VVPSVAAVAQKFSNLYAARIALEPGIALNHFAAGAITKALSADLPIRMQAKLQEFYRLHDSREKSRKAATGNSKDRLDATRRKHASAWISAFPNKPLGLWLPPAEFAASARCWLGVSSHAETKALLKPGLAMYGRHHAVQECLMSLAMSAGVAARREVLIDTSTNQRPADVSSRTGAEASRTQ